MKIAITLLILALTHTYVGIFIDMGLSEGSTAAYSLLTVIYWFAFFLYSLLFKSKEIIRCLE